MTWDRELRVLGEAIRRLNAEYDAFLFGSVTRPPVQSRRHVEEMFRRLTQSPSESAADRYQLSTLQGRFSTLCERWERLQAEKEAGRRPGIPAGFSTPGPGSSPNAGKPGSVEANREDGSPRDRQLFERYVAARGRLGEEVSGFRLEQFLARLAEERGRLRERLGVAEIDFDVVERDGRVKLVAKPKESPKSEIRGRK
ncbi:MAG TPA: MXAN_5187 C-terminal domain-containing protein [Thermoanaerobaculia bacterium]|nr:MXAN_5187 C-terminal domain-containing protein [Thermoanaerobaculia bacterium]